MVIDHVSHSSGVQTAPQPFRAPSSSPLPSFSALFAAQSEWSAVSPRQFDHPAVAAASPVQYDAPADESPPFDPPAAAAARPDQVAAAPEAPQLPGNDAGDPAATADDAPTELPAPADDAATAPVTTESHVDGDGAATSSAAAAGAGATAPQRAADPHADSGTAAGRRHVIELDDAALAQLGAQRRSGAAQISPPPVALSASTSRRGILAPSTEPESAAAQAADYEQEGVARVLRAGRRAIVSVVDKVARGSINAETPVREQLTTNPPQRLTAAAEPAAGGKDAHILPTNADPFGASPHYTGDSSVLRVGDTAPKTVQQFQQFLQREIAPSVVRHARFVFHTEQESEVRIVLQPAELGVMRLKLFMQNNTIHGKIIVDNPLAKDIIENSVTDIHKALRDNGVDSGAIDVDINPHAQTSWQQPLPISAQQPEPVADQATAAAPTDENNAIYANSVLINLYA